MQQQKLYNDMNLIYNNTCVISGNNQLIDLCITSIIPPNILNNNDILNYKYNYIVLTHKLADDFNKFKFTIHPDPISFDYIKVGNKYMKAGKFRVVPHPFYDNKTFEIILLYNSRVYLKWHFLKFFEANNFNPIYWNIKWYNGSLDYLNNYVSNIGHINSEYIKDKYNNILFTDDINYY